MIYGLLLYFFTKAILELTAFLAVVVLLGILAWIGWTMATTPPPEPMRRWPPHPSAAPAPHPFKRLRLRSSKVKGRLENQAVT